ncbi:type III-B CRISPR module RAMP protein Cmr4 [Desulfoscipio sp. XC116]|uniref:type III-B CRISPR module RAMP protein Cmr4 n=1 Tax=Desulfoscipio sp. XC116 TaxID=3144975 RepID=UPI00325A4579
MFKLSKALFLSALTPMHVGSGSDLGIVDLPIQRENHTSFPKIEGSSMKGCIKEALLSQEAFRAPADKIWKYGEQEIDYKSMVYFAFGPESEEDGKFASAVALSDARLLFFPVKSVKGVFAWVTCPLVLKRFWDDMKIAGISLPLEIPAENTIIPNSALCLSSDPLRIMLEEFPISVQECSKLSCFVTEIKKFLPQNELTEQMFADHVAVINDDDFRDFVNLSTEVITRVRIGESGTVEDGALFNEEYLPSDSLLYSLVLISPIFIDKKDQTQVAKIKDIAVEKQPEFIADFLEKNMPDILQIGGSMTLGKGLIGVKLNSAKANTPPKGDEADA